MLMKTTPGETEIILKYNILIILKIEDTITF